MTTLDQIRTGLTTRLGTIPDTHVYGWVVDTIDPPAILVQPPTIPSYFGDLDSSFFEATIEAAVLVSTATDQNQLHLFPYLERTGTKSIFATVMADTSLGGLSCEAKPISSRPLGRTTLGEVSYYGAAVAINVIVMG